MQPNNRQIINNNHIRLRQRNPTYWRSLSDTLGEDINKSNFRFTVKRQKGDHLILTKPSVSRPVVIKISLHNIIVTSNNFRFKIIRQALFFCGEFSDYNLLNKVLKSTLEYRGLPA